MSFLSEFKAFAMRGNVVDLAVAVVIGAVAPSREETLLTDIRDLIKSHWQSTNKL